MTKMKATYIKKIIYKSIQNKMSNVIDRNIKDEN